MWARPVSALVALLVVAGISSIGCSSARDEEVEDESSDDALFSSNFDRNNVLDDGSMLDVDAMNVGDVQKFFEDTPYRSSYTLGITKIKSVLADYRDPATGKLAAEIVVDAAKKYHLNPLLFLTALQVENSLISTRPSSRNPFKIGAVETDEKVKFPFNCVCPARRAVDGADDQCSDRSPGKYTGFAAQADCYGGEVSRALALAKTKQDTPHGFSTEHDSLSADKPDQLVVHPKNAATSALYDYVPIVGERGGGQEGIGGVSGFGYVWKKFADSIDYVPKGATPGKCLAGVFCGDAKPACTTDAECSATTPVCDIPKGKCVACKADFGTSASGAFVCPASSAPACLPTGECGECTTKNSSLCARSTETPACNVSKNKCGCTADPECGAGRVCDTSGGPAGTCIDGCRVVAGKDSCATGLKCNDTTGDIGTCENPKCSVGTAGTCQTGLTCDTTRGKCVGCITDANCAGGKVCEATTSSCVDCTQTNTGACSASGTGASCLAVGKCGCLVNADCGGRVCDTAKHVCTSQLAPTGPSGTDAGAPTSPTGNATPTRADGGTGTAAPPSAVSPTNEPEAYVEPPSGSSQREGVTPKPAAAKKKPAPPDQTGCSASGSAPTDMAPWALALTAVALTNARRRRARA